MKNLKLNLMYLFNIIIGVLLYVFLSQAYLTFKVESPFGNDNTSASNGYDIIKNYFDGNGTEVMMALSNLLVAILAGLLILTSIYCLIVSLGGIKKSKAYKFVNFINVILALAIVVFAAISLFCTIAEANDNSLSMGGYSTGLSVGWAVIVNLVISVFTILTTILAIKFSKK